MDVLTIQSPVNADNVYVWWSDDPVGIARMVAEGADLRIERRWRDGNKNPTYREWCRAHAPDEDLTDFSDALLQYAYAMNDTKPAPLPPFHTVDHFGNAYRIIHGAVATDEPTSVILVPVDPH